MAWRSSWTGRWGGPPGSGSPRVAAGWCCGGITGVRKVRGSLAARNRSGGGNSPERGPAKSRRSTGLGPRQRPQDGCWLRGDAPALVFRGSGAAKRRGRGGTEVRRRGAYWRRRRLGLGEAGVRGRGHGWFKGPGPKISACGIGKRAAGFADGYHGQFVARAGCASGWRGEGDDPDPWVRPGSEGGEATRTGWAAGD